VSAWTQIQAKNLKVGMYIANTGTVSAVKHTHHNAFVTTTNGTSDLQATYPSLEPVVVSIDESRDIPPSPWEASKWFRSLKGFHAVEPECGWSALEIEDTGEGWIWSAYEGMGGYTNPDETKYATSALAIAAAEAWVRKYPDMREHSIMQDERWVIRHKQYPEKYWCRTVGLSGGWLRNEDKAMTLDGIQKREFDAALPKFGEWHLSYSRSP
jgi:hypothetical protein